MLSPLAFAKISLAFLAGDERMLARERRCADAQQLQQIHVLRPVDALNLGAHPLQGREDRPVPKVLHQTQSEGIERARHAVQGSQVNGRERDPVVLRVAAVRRDHAFD